MAFVVAGGYDARGRRLSPELRSAVLAAHDGRCVACGINPATQVDHIDGPSSHRANLQGLCKQCHEAKTEQRMVPMSAEDKAVRDGFLSLVWSPEPAILAHDELQWDAVWRTLLAETRRWCFPMVDDIESGEFVDGSTGMVDDYEHGTYMQMLADRDD